jgi:hypothetical protein
MLATDLLVIAQLALGLAASRVGCTVNHPL